MTMYTVLPLLSLLVACKKDPPPGLYNDPPTARIVSEAPARPEADILYAMSGEGNDPDGDALEAAWYADTTLVCDYAPLVDGASACAARIPADARTVTLDVRDPYGAAAQDSIAVQLAPSTPPLVEITSPNPDDRLYTGYATALFGRITSPPERTFDPLALDVAWTVENASAEASHPDADVTADGDVSGEAILAQGINRVTLTATDVHGRVGTASVALYVEGENQTPNCRIELPTDDAVVASGDRTDFRAFVSDPDIDTSDPAQASRLAVSWTSSITTQSFPAASVDADGLVLASDVALEDGEHRITFRVEDELGAFCTTTVDVSVGAGTEPAVTITSPTAGEVLDEGEVITFEASISDVEDPDDALSVEWRSDIDGVLNITPPTGGRSRFDATGLRAAPHTVTLTVTDPDANVTVRTVSFDVNALPTAPTVTIEETGTADGVELNAVASGSTDADGAVSYTYAWVKAASSVTATGPTVDASATARGDTWTVTATPVDPRGGEGPTGTASVTVGDSPPYVTGVSIAVDDGTPTEASELSCSYGALGDADGDETSALVTWTVSDGTTTSSYVTDTLDGASFAYGDEVRCTITPYSDAGSGVIEVGTPEESSATTIANSVPVASAVTISPSPARVADTLTCNATLTDADASQSVGMTVSWTYADGSAAGTGPTLAGIHVKGDSLQCSVTPNDGVADGAAVSSSLLTIANTAPGISGVTLTGTAAFGSDVVCTVSASDADAADSLQYTYAWYKSDGSSSSIVRSSATSSDTDTYTVLATDLAATDLLQCRATVSDGAATTGIYSSAYVGLANRPPTIVGSVTLSPATAYTDDTLTASASASDPDGGTTTVRYAWYVEGLLVGDSDATLEGAFFSKGDTVLVDATPNDGSLDGTAVRSSAILIQNTVPSVRSVGFEPAAPTVANPIDCEADVTDADGDPVSVTYAWTVDGTTSATTARTLPAGEASAGAEVACTVTPSDGTATGASASVSAFVGNSPPGVYASLTPSAAYEATPLTCTGLAVDADGAATFTYTYNWYVGTALIATVADTSATTATLDGADFDEADVVTCGVVANDGTSASAEAMSDPVTIANTAPIATSATITPSTATEATTLTCAGAGSDDDAADTIAWSYTWRVGAATYTGATLTGASFRRGDTLTCSATPRDEAASGGAVTSSAIVVANTPPTLSTVTISPSTATTNSTLTCVPTSSDIDGDTVSHSYLWRVDGVDAGTSPTLAGTEFDSGDVITCTATPSDGTDAGAAQTSAGTTIANSAPVATATLSPTTARRSTTFTCTPGATDDDGTTSFTYTYSWWVDGVVLSGRADATLTSGFGNGDGVQCGVVANDGVADSARVLSSTVTVGNTAPAISSVAITSSTGATATEASTLTCEATGTDVDGDTVSFTYAWTIGGAAGPTSRTVTGASFAKGQSITCTATPSDGTDTGTATTSAAITVANSAPTTTSVALSPATPYVTDTLTCTPTSSDADAADTLTHTYAWRVDGVTLAATGATLAAPNFASGDVVSCTATVSDGTDSGAARTSTSVTVGNSTPSATVSLSPTTAYESSTLTCAAVASDADGSTSFTYTWRWYVGGTLTATTTGTSASATLTGASFSKGNAVYCTVAVSDGTSTSTAVTSNTVTISNSAPTIASVAVTPASATRGSTLTCTPSASDADGDTVTYTYAWYVNGAGVGAATSSTYTGTYVRGDAVYCTVVASDGAASSSIGTSANVTIGNTAPTVTSVTIASSSGAGVYREASTLTCTPVGTDADGDTITYTYAWTIGGVAGPTTAAVDGDDFAKGNAISCTATPSDGTAAGTAATSAAVTIADTAPTIASVTIASSSGTGVYREGSTLTCTPSGTDADGDTITYTYTWSGTTGSPTTAAITGSSFSKGNTLTCTATPTAASATGTAATSASITVANTAPTATASLSPSPPVAGAAVSCVAVGADADSDTVTFTYTWRVNSSTVAAATSASLAASNFAAGNTVECRATPSDGTDTGTVATASGTVASSMMATRANRAPEAPEVAIEPEDPEEGDALLCAVTADATDADGDAVTLRFAWTVDGLPYDGPTETDAHAGDTVPADQAFAGEVWACAAVADDGADTSAEAVAEVTVLPARAWYGEPWDLGDTCTVAADVLVAQRVSLPDERELVSLGALLGVDNTAAMQLALYADAGDTPGAMIIATDATAGAGDLEIEVEPRYLLPGEYWIVWLAHDVASLGAGDCEDGAVEWAPWDAADGAPELWPGSDGRVEDRCYNVWFGAR